MCCFAQVSGFGSSQLAVADSAEKVAFLIVALFCGSVRSCSWLRPEGWVRDKNASWFLGNRKLAPPIVLLLMSANNPTPGPSPRAVGFGTSLSPSAPRSQRGCLSIAEKSELGYGADRAASVK